MAVDINEGSKHHSLPVRADLGLCAKFRSENMLGESRMGICAVTQDDRDYTKKRNAGEKNEKAGAEKAKIGKRNNEKSEPSRWVWFRYPFDLSMKPSAAFWNDQRKKGGLARKFGINVRGAASARSDGSRVFGRPIFSRMEIVQVIFPG